MDWEQQLGIKLSLIIAGLAGGVTSLTYEDKVSAPRAMFLISTGAVTAAYIHPLIQAIIEHYFPAINITQNLSVSIAFVLGLIAMKLIKIALKIGTLISSVIDYFTKNPTKVLAYVSSLKITINKQPEEGGEETKPTPTQDDSTNDI